jgi:hypothetical protein
MNNEKKKKYFILNYLTLVLLSHLFLQVFVNQLFIKIKQIKTGHTI